MKFAHLADCHIGGWREEPLKKLNLSSFEKAIDVCIQNHVGFIIIAGDLFDTALPSIDILKQAAKIISKLKEYDIPVYLIPGSHDFSASGKTMLDVLENSGLVTNVMTFKDNRLQFTEDRTGVKLTGIYGKKGGLEKADYENLEKSHLEQEQAFKIFIFHTLLTELKPKELEKADSAPLILLPKNFDYYAGGHPHFIYSKFHEDYGIISYPGPIFPNNFQELEKLKHGGFYLIETKGDKLEIKHIPLNLVETLSYSIDAENKTPKEIEQEILKITNYENKLITIRIKGTLKEGRISDIKFKEVFENLKGVYHILKNTTNLVTKEFQEQEIDLRDANEIENSIINQHSGQSIFSEEKIKEIIKTLETEKLEGEKNADFESRLIDELSKIIEI